MRKISWLAASLLSVSTLLSITGLSDSVLAGSVNGGGGGTVPASPIGAARIEMILRGDVRGPLLMLFRHLDMGGAGVIRAEEQRILYGSPSIYDIIDNTPIEAILSGPCKDRDGNEVDGSVVTTSTPNGICISLARLGSKLDRSNAFPQTAALVAHELAHKLGFDESAAENLQRLVLLYLEEGEISAKSAREYGTRVFQAAANAANTLDWFNDFAETASWDQSCERARWFIERYGDIETLIFEGPRGLSILPHKNDATRDYGIKAFGMRVAACGHADAPIRTMLDEDIFAKYSSLFTQNQPLSIKNFALGMWGTRQQLSTAIMMRFIETGATLKTESADVHTFLGTLGKEAMDLTKPALVIVRHRA